MRTALLTILGLALGLAAGYLYRDQGVRRAVSEAYAADSDAEQKLERKDPTNCRSQRDALRTAFERCVLANEGLRAQTRECDDAVAARTFKYKTVPKTKKGGAR